MFFGGESNYRIFFELCVQIPIFSQNQAAQFLPNRLFSRSIDSHEKLYYNSIEHRECGRCIIVSNNKSDTRREILTSIIKSIFETLVNDTAKSENTVVVIRGKGDEIGKCSFQALHRERYTNLLKYTFKYKDCTFEYAGKQKSGQVFDRNTAIKNAVKFFKKIHVDLDYSFRSPAENYLFSQLIYEYIKLLLDVLFDDYSNILDRNSEVKKRYDEALAIIRQKVLRTDILDLIYAKKDVVDLEVIIDPQYKQNECNRAFLINAEGAVSCLGVKPIKNKVMLCVKGNEYSSTCKSTSSEEHISGVQFDSYPLPIDEKFFISQDTSSLSMNVWPNLYRRYKNPRWLYYATKHPIEFNVVPTNDDEAVALRNKAKAYMLDIYGAAYQYLLAKYPQNKKDAYLQWLSSLDNILGRILHVNYNNYFDGGYSNIISVDPAFMNLTSFMRNNGIDSSNAEIIYKYLVSTLIDDLCQNIDNFNIEDMFRHLSLDDKEVKKLLTNIKGKCKSPNLDVPCFKYKDFYDNNKSLIHSFEGKVEISRDRCTASIADEGYNPYRYLKDMLSTFSERLG